ncbi:hypothetical protein Pfo_019169 [Paulownia fortunei]|nr:hypothetical protein Pfo_019169 [Paulownia fortunei]
MVTKKRCSLDVASYNVRFMHNRKPEGLIEEMTNAGIKPNMITYNLLITFYGENKMMDEVKVFDELLKAKDCNPNAMTFRSLVFYLCKHGWVMTGYNVFKQSVKVNKTPSFGTLKYLAEGLVEKGHMNEAKDLIRTMSKKFPPNLLDAWGKLAEDLGLAPVSTKEVDSGEKEKGVDSVEKKKGINGILSEKYWKMIVLIILMIVIENGIGFSIVPVALYENVGRENRNFYNANRILEISNIIWWCSAAKTSDECLSNMSVWMLVVSENDNPLCIIAWIGTHAI